MKTNPRRYEALKILTVLLGALSLPVDLYCAISFSDGAWLRGGVLFFVSTVMYVVISFLYYKVMEQMNDRQSP